MCWWCCWRPRNPRLPEHPLTEEELRRLFREHDKNKDGHLDKAELAEAFRKLGSRVPTWQAKRAINDNDLDLDGDIDEHEIEHLVSYCLQRGFTDLKFSD